MRESNEADPPLAPENNGVRGGVARDGGERVARRSSQKCLSNGRGILRKGVDPYKPDDLIPGLLPRALSRPARSSSRPSATDIAPPSSSSTGTTVLLLHHQDRRGRPDAHPELARADLVLLLGCEFDDAARLTLRSSTGEPPLRLIRRWNGDLENDAGKNEGLWNRCLGQNLRARARRIRARRDEMRRRPYEDRPEDTEK